MHALDLEPLLRDAEVLARHAARVGKFPPGSTVHETIAEIRSDAVQSGSAVARLHHEIDALAKAVAPATIKQLSRRDSLLHYLRHAVAIVTPFAIGFVTLLLTLYLAFQSSQLHQADTALREYQEWAAQQPREKLYAAWKMYRYERVLNVKEPPLAQLDAYQKLVEDARRLVDKGSAIQTLLQDSATTLTFPRFMENTGPDSLQKLVRTLNWGPMQRAEVLKTLPEAPGASGGVPTLRQPNCDGQSPRPLGVALPTLPQAADIDAYFNSIDCFLQRLNISEERMSYSPWSVIYQTKSKVNLLVVWLLPGLYGLLGACVYLMRSLVLARSPLVHNATVLSMLSLLLRIALGGLAGIIIGWFWVPVSAGNAHGVAPISSIPFGLAFLAGFSIETLFSLLDRLNKAIEHRDSVKT